MTTRKLAAAAVALLLLGVPGCDTSRDQIVGKWKVDGDAGAMVWEFAKNGSVKAGNNPGKYSFGDRNRLKIQTQFATFVYEVEFAGNRMIWKEPSGSRSELKRVP